MDQAEAQKILGPIVEGLLQALQPVALMEVDAAIDAARRTRYREIFEGVPMYEEALSPAARIVFDAFRRMSIEHIRLVEGELRFHLWGAHYITKPTSLFARTWNATAKDARMKGTVH